MRHLARALDQLREIRIETHVNDYAEGSCLVHFGKTRVMCTASLEDGVPPFLRNTGKGWVTAEYGMLPRSTHSRMRREAGQGKQSGRTVEIQRLIGRSLRAVTKLGGFGERQITVDCDVLHADGGTRTASVTGGYVALHLAFRKLADRRIVNALPLLDTVAAVSCGIHQGKCMLDLEYAEDSNAEADANFVLTGKGGIVEIQGTAEQDPFTEAQFAALFELAKKGCAELAVIQQEALGG